MAWDQKRIILTHDMDFMNDAEFPFHRNPGVIVLPGASGPTARGLQPALASVLNMFGHYGKLFPHHKIVISTDNVWNVRCWDKRNGRIRYDKYRMNEPDKAFIWKDE
jgi:hypothetical protein